MIGVMNTEDPEFQNLGFGREGSGRSSRARTRTACGGDEIGAREGGRGGEVAWLWRGQG